MVAIGGTGWLEKAFWTMSIPFGACISARHAGNSSKLNIQRQRLLTGNAYPHGSWTPGTGTGTGTCGRCFWGVSEADERSHHEEVLAAYTRRFVRLRAEPQSAGVVPIHGIEGATKCSALFLRLTLGSCARLVSALNPVIARLSQTSAGQGDADPRLDFLWKAPESMVKDEPSQSSSWSSHRKCLHTSRPPLRRIGKRSDTSEI
jgi:hypothetical protein